MRHARDRQPDAARPPHRCSSMYDIRSMPLASPFSRRDASWTQEGGPCRDVWVRSSSASQGGCRRTYAQHAGAALCCGSAATRYALPCAPSPRTHLRLEQEVQLHRAGVGLGRELQLRARALGVVARLGVRGNALARAV